MRRGHFIAGQECGQDGPSFEVIDPSTRAPMGHAALGTAADIDRAVTAAQDAQRSWWSLAPGERERVLLRCADHVETYGGQLTETLMAESGS
ncbi:MAG TPA: hypothetical protein DIU15_10920, partial [Deltaproteobacteria bacterium]|nr:hypothetical protein [Deltaproteobacteria bacterium]